MTGGEPTIRRSFASLLERLHALSPSLSLGITTNALTLSRQLPTLEKYLKNVNISLDTLVEEKFEWITKRRGFQRVWKGIHEASSFYVFFYHRSIMLFFFL